MMIKKIDNWFLNTVTGELSEQLDFSEVVFTLDHTPLELLLCLIRYQGQDVTKDTMLSEVWPNKVVTEDVLSVAISQIRKAIGDKARQPKYIKTIPSVGYRLIAPAIDVEIESKTQEVVDTPNEPHNETQKNSRLTSTFIVALTSVLIIFVGYMVWSQLHNEKNTTVLNVGQLPTPEIDNLYKRARYLSSTTDKDKWLEAQQMFEDTIIQVPEFAAAYRDLADIKFKINNQNLENLYVLSTELTYLLNKAISLNPNDHHAIFLLANYTFWLSWDVNTAEELYLKALSLKPDNSEYHHSYSQLLLAKGDFESSLKHTNKYIELDPKSYIIPSVAWIYSMSGDFETAQFELNKLRQFDAGHDQQFLFHTSAQGIYERANKIDQAGNHLFEVLKLSKYTEEQIAHAKGALDNGGLKNLYSWLLNEKKETAWLGQYEPPLSFARYAIGAGELDRAVQLLLEAKKQRRTALLWYNVDSKYDPVRNHPKLKNFINF